MTRERPLPTRTTVESERALITILHSLVILASGDWRFDILEISTEPSCTKNKELKQNIIPKANIRKTILFFHTMLYHFQLFLSAK